VGSVIGPKWENLKHSKNWKQLFANALLNFSTLLYNCESKGRSEKSFGYKSIETGRTSTKMTVSFIFRKKKKFPTFELGIEGNPRDFAATSPVDERSNILPLYSQRYTRQENFPRAAKNPCSLCCKPDIAGERIEAGEITT
jgi:hypothetical protein